MCRLLQLFQVPVFECFLGNDAAVMGQFFQGAADDQQVQRQFLHRFHQLHAKHGVIIYFAAAFQKMEKSIRHCPVVTDKKFADAFKTIFSFNIDEDIIGSGFHVATSINHNAISDGYKL
mgnify:CR=1 FL=1